MRFSMFAIVGLAFAAACGGGGDNGTGPIDNGGGGGGGALVHAKRVTATAGLAFDPSAVSIPVNDSIFFTFQGVQHNVIFDSPSSPADIGNTTSATVKRQFPSAGTYDYHCSIHPQMTGSVTVTP
jgi:plastocyanin